MVSKKEKGKSSLPGRKAGRELSVIPRGGAAIGFRDAITGLQGVLSVQGRPTPILGSDVLRKAVG